MTTTTELKLCKGLPYQIRVRARGEFDEVLDNQAFSQDSSVSVNMTTYNGLSEDYVKCYQTADIVDFTGTVLPYKFEYSDTLQTSRFCLMPQGQAYSNVTPLVLTPSNFTVVGSLNISQNKVVRGFSTSNYATLSNSFRPQNNPWEMVFKFNALSGGGQIFTKTITGGYYGIWIYFDGTENKIGYYVDRSSSGGGSAHIVNQRGTNTLSQNTWWYVKFEFTGSAYNGYVSTDGVNWTQDLALSSSDVLYDSTYTSVLGIRIGDLSEPFDGSIDLSESYIKVNGADFWVPSFTESTGTSETLAGCLKNVEDDGSAQTLSAWAIGNQYVVLCPEAFKYMTQQTIGYILGSNANYIGDVSVPQHTVYTYDNGTWTEYTPPSYVRQFTVTGSPTIDDEACTVSGFSSNDYITADTSFAPAQGDDWTLRCSFIAPAPNGSNQVLAESHGFLFAIDEDGFLYFSDSDGTNSDSIFINEQMQEGDVIDLVVNYNNGGYDWEFYNDTQGTSYSDSQVATLTGPVNSSTPVFGVSYHSHTNAFNGTLRMLDCQMIVSNGGVTSLNWMGYVYE